MIKKITLIIITLSFFLMSIINIPKTHALEPTFYQDIEYSYLENINNRVYSSSSDNGLYWLIDETTFYNNYPANGYAVRINNDYLDFTSGDLSTLILYNEAVELSTLYQTINTYYLINLKYWATQKYPVTWVDSSTIIYIATGHAISLNFLLQSPYIQTGNDNNNNYYERMLLYYKDFKIYLNDSISANYNNGAEMGYWQGYNVGYNDGYAIGYNAGLYENNEKLYNAGYSAGKLEWETIGYNAGLQTGFNNGYLAGLDAGANINPSVDWIKSLFIGMGAFLSVEIFPNVTIGLIVAIPLLFSLLLWFVKLIRG